MPELTRNNMRRSRTPTRNARRVSN
jgi:hypothetical protein